MSLRVLIYLVNLNFLFVSPQGLNYLVKQNLQHVESYGDNHECFRACEPGETKICKYIFDVIPYSAMNDLCQSCPKIKEDCHLKGCVTAGGVPRLISSVNMQIPGPSILVCENDTIIVEVRNQLRTEGITIHWHGVHQVGSLNMDGVPYITQEPILPFQNYTYKFKAHPHGTHMWHGHSGFQESDGLFGILTIRRKEPKVIRSLYDYDLHEHTLIVWHWYDQMTSDILPLILSRYEKVSGFGLLINGKGPLKSYHFEGNQSSSTVHTDRQVFKVTKGLRYRFRIIFNSAIYCPIEVSIDSHEMKVFASDASTFQPVGVQSIMMNAGERYDFVLNTNQKEDCYWMRIRGFGDCGPNKTSVHQEAILCYGSIDKTPAGGPPTYQQGRKSGKLLNPIEEASSDYKKNTLIHLPDLKNTDERSSLNATPNVTYYIQVHSKVLNSLIYPGPWHQFNNITFTFPSSNLLAQKNDNELCFDSNPYCSQDFCRCVYTKAIAVNSLVEIIFVDISIDRDQDHPVHLHGYQFYVVATGLLGHNVSMDLVKKMNENGEINKNLNNPPAKDSLSIPNMGYTVIRFYADNPGYWLMHCHVTNHMELGMAMLLQVGDHALISSPYASSASSYDFKYIFIVMLLPVHMILGYNFVFLNIYN